MKHTKIVSTLGPSSHTIAVIEKLAHAGANVFRLNFSHGDFEEHGHRIEQIRKLEKKMGKRFPIVLDTKGPDIRTEAIEGKITVKKGDTFTWTVSDSSGWAKNQKNRVSHDGFAKDVKVGDTVVVDSGALTMTVTKKTKTDVVCKVNEPGTFGGRKHINLPGKKLSMPTITPKDWADIDFGIKNDLDFCALSFCSSAADVHELRDYLKKKKSGMQIIPKIENVVALENLEEIIEAADGVMVARGDLGVEIPFAHVPQAQYEIIQFAAKHRKTVIVATEMLDSMIEKPTPTRAEVADVSNAVFQRTDATMLSGETAQGDYPKKAVAAMADIATETEAHVIPQKPLRRGLPITNAHGAMAKTVAQMAADLDDIVGIVAITASGRTAINVAAHRPRVPIYAFTNSVQTCRQLQLAWGVEPDEIKFYSKTPEKTVRSALNQLLKKYPKWKGRRVIVHSGVLIGKEFCLTTQVREL